MSRVLLIWCALAPFAARGAFAQAEPSVPEKVTPSQVLLLGPLPVFPPLLADHEAARAAGFVAELDPAAQWPAAGDLVTWTTGEVTEWTEYEPVLAGAAMARAQHPRSVAWIAFYAHADRYGRLRVEARAPGDVRVYLDGSEVGQAGNPEALGTSVSGERTLPRGTHRVLVRLERTAGDAAAVEFAVCPLDGQRMTLRADPRHPLTDYRELQDRTYLSGLLLSPDGELLAVRRGGDVARLLIVDVRSGAVVAMPGAGDTAAVQWSRDANRLLLRAGGDLLVWDRQGGDVTQVLDDEPGLGEASWSDDGRLIVFASHRGTEDPKKGSVRRRDLRERLSDWPTRPHLHVVSVPTGARRRLAVPGDWVQDAFAILPDNRTLVYLRNVPRAGRPWFLTEFRALDLSSGDDRLVQSMVMGFENRPALSGFALAPDGSKVAFIGPPAELGDRALLERNAFDPDLYVMHLADGRWYKASEGLDAAVAGSVRFGADSRRVFFHGHDGAVDRLFEAVLPERPGDPVRFHAYECGGEAIHGLSAVDGGRFAALVSDTDRLPVLVVAAEGAPRLLLDPDRELQRRLLLPAPVDTSFALEDGTPIECWLYRPVEMAPPPPDERLPLIVYYYGGANPTARGFNELHQFLVGHGYALLVINPRGASGYGPEFADHHAGDWGEKAGADILRAVDIALERHADLDPARIGCYGGSYGGFMTMWLLTRTDRFQAAVSLYGISNLASYFGDGTWGWTYGDQAMAGRTPWSDAEWYVAHSPLYHADKIRTPLLLLHGEADSNVPVHESEQMFTALRLLDRPVELVRFPGEDHGIRGTFDNRAAHRTMMLEWFDKHLRGQGQAWEERWQR